MKHPLLFILLASLTGLKAQDYIYKKDNSKIAVKVTEVAPDEIRYKAFENPNGPTYVIAKDKVTLIVFENGQQEIINTGSASSKTEKENTGNHPGTAVRTWGSDSSKYFRYENSVGVNFLNFANNEFGIIYQKEDFRRHFNVVVPFAFGIRLPRLTQSVYFSNSNTMGFFLRRKLFELGLGVNYFPSYRSNVNYYVGPMLRYLKYEGVQEYYRHIAGFPASLIVKNTTLTRYAFSITNGIMVRTRSRLSLNLFASIGFKHDALDNPIIEPSNGLEIHPFKEPMSLYIWTGFNIAFGF
jgi:hypothetical protein